MRSFSLFLALNGCPFGVDTDSAVHSDSGPIPTRWYLTCGDPVCQGYTGPNNAVEICDDEFAGNDCNNEGSTCDPVDDCNALLTCATKDPTKQQGGCPISLAQHKREIRSLSDAERAALVQSALTMPLTTWSYRWDPPGTPQHLGFLIDDNEGSVAVAADGQHVDLYGYTSLTLLSVQDQADRVAAQWVRLNEQDTLLAAQGVRLAGQAMQLSRHQSRLAKQESRLYAQEVEIRTLRGQVEALVARQGR